MNRYVLAALGGAVAGALVATQVAGPLVAQEATKSAEVYRQLDLFGDIFERVRAQYVEETEPAELIEAAINGMLTSLDPHSGYLPPKEFDDMQVQTRGQFGGLGIEVTQENGWVKVVAPMDDTPADRAGVQAGDFITHVDGESTLGLTLDQAVEKMRGPVGSEIVVAWGRSREGFFISIVDHGSGLPSGFTLDRIQMGNSSKQGHLGMGLSLIRKAAESLGATVKLTGRTDRGARLELHAPDGA
jgi:carboxyl-terminal processing protease